MADRNLYDILNVAPGAEPEVLEAAYRALMKKYHPDRHVDAGAPGQRASEVNAAFAVLRDRRSRSEYDQQLRATRVQPAPAGTVRPASFQPPPHFQQPPPAPPPRRLNIAAWSGWGVALGFACFAAAMPFDPSVQRLEPTIQSIASLDSDAAPNEQPEPVPVRPVPPGVPLDPDGLTVQLRTLQETLREHSSGAPAAQASARAAPERVARAPVPRRIAAAAPRREPPRRSRQSDRDFLEREGFIY
jgi:hypothetical protein